MITYNSSSANFKFIYLIFTFILNKCSFLTHWKEGNFKRDTKIAYHDIQFDYILIISRVYTILYYYLVVRFSVKVGIWKLWSLKDIDHFCFPRYWQKGQGKAKVRNPNMKYENGFKHLWYLASGNICKTNDENLWFFFIWLSRLVTLYNIV